MGILSWIVVGGIAGWLAGLIMKGYGFGLFGNIIVGIVGALVGGWLAGLTGIGGEATGINIGSLITATVGAIVLLFIIGLFKKNS